MPRLSKSLLAAALVAAAATGPGTPAAAQDMPFIGEIMLVGYNFCPRGWAEADGRLLPIQQYTALFSLVGTTFGGNGQTNFALPDLRGRVPVGVGTGPGLSANRLGQSGGSETNTLTVGNLPPHSHTLGASSAAGTTGAPGGNLPANAGRESIYGTGTPDAPMSGAAIGNTGGGQAVNNMPPYLVMRYCIALEGLYPSRP